MPYDYFVRITHSYDECRTLVSRWALECDKMAVYEHIGSATEKVHIHLALEGCRVQSKTLRQQAERVSQVPLKGNQNCSMKAWDKSDVTMVYMTKGNLDPKYLRGWSEAEALEWKSRYVQPTPKQESKSEVLKVYEEHFLYEQLNRAWVEVMKDNPISLSLFVRRKAMREALAMNKNMITPKTCSDAKTLYLTFMYRNGIRLEPNDPYYKYCSWQTPPTKD